MTTKTPPPPPPKHNSPSSPSIDTTTPTPSHTSTPTTDQFLSLPLPIQQQLDRLQLSTNIQIEALASTFTQRFDQLFTLFHTSQPIQSHTHPLQPQFRPPPGPFPRSHPPPFPNQQTLPDNNTLRGPQIRLDTPKFDGQDPVGWIFRVEEYFEYYSVSHNERLRLVSLCLEGQASEWFRWMRANSLLHS